MAKLIRKLVVENNMRFDDIVSFRAGYWIGIWDFHHDEFVMFAKEDSEFRIVPLPECNDLQGLDNEVYKLSECHIDEVYDECKYEFILKV